MSKICLYLTALLILLQLLSIFTDFNGFWAYIPVFRYRLSAEEISYAKSVHTGILHDLNIGYYFQLIMFVFSLMIFASKKRLISFHIGLASVIIHSLILLIEVETGGNESHALIKDQPFYLIVNSFYILFFTLLMIGNYLFDTKKGSVREPFKISEDID